MLIYVIKIDTNVIMIERIMHRFNLQRYDGTTYAHPTRNVGGSTADEQLAKHRDVGGLSSYQCGGD